MLFILLIPVFLLLFAFVVDIGFLYVESKQMASSVEDSVEYGLKNIENENIKEKIEILINQNIKDVASINVEQRENTLYVSVQKEHDGMFDFIFKNNIYKLESSYYGYVHNGKLVINKE